MAVLKDTTAGFAVGLVILVAVGAASEAQGTLKRLLLSILEAQAGRRAYPLTGEDQYLHPYYEAEGRVGVFWALVNEPPPRAASGGAPNG